MTHPPIPPKSEFFYIRDGNPCFSMPDSDPAYSWAFQLNDREYWDRRTRKHVAAVAEVEWRKRAERWTVLMNYYDDYTRRSAYAKEAHKSHKNAIAWRDWGEGK